MNKTDRSPLGLYMIGIAALFLAGFFLLVVFGAQSYRNAVSGQTGNMHTRALLSYLSTCVKANDEADGVSVTESEDGQVLVVADGTTGYALRIYRHDGALLEDYAKIDAPLAPDAAQVIGATEVFEAELEDDLLYVTTDAGHVMLRLRSEGGAE